MANEKVLLKEKDKKKKQRVRSMKSIETELWELCRAITKILYKHCYTCSQTNLVGVNAQCGHMHPKGACGASMKYDLRILRLQCFQCNINYGGMGAVYLENMKREIGAKKATELLAEAKASKGKPIKTRWFYIEKILEYTELRDKLLNNEKTRN